MINYAEIGSEIEHNMDLDELLEFCKKHSQSTDQDMAKLAMFAAFKAASTKSRLDGCIADCAIHESNADFIYSYEIRPDNRW